MLKFKQMFLCVTFCATFVFCTKSGSVAPAPTSFIGSWTIFKVYGNDVYGAPYFWKDADDKTKIRFTNDGKYFRKYFTDSIYTLIGGYLVKFDSTILITPISVNGDITYPYTLFYQFEIGGYMTWGNFAYEGVVKEKYRKD